MSFPNHFKAARIAASLSQPAAARLLGVSVATVRNWEHGRSEPPAVAPMTKADVLAKMDRPDCDYYGQSL